MITPDEIERATMTMKRGKTPGPEGFSVEFFRHSWSVVKADVIEMICSFCGINAKTVRIVSDALKLFGELSSLKPDLEKSTLYVAALAKRHGSFSWSAPRNFFREAAYKVFGNFTHCKTINLCRMLAFN
ncbi:hypothetical protein LIER_36767 [Lithospermum erythrorhizon]|uniref:Uncharacterized protein n=1 Tax=Lithospermum erythrorhizon TaxID=34254 RepID=A0AAV3PF22_LITER